MPEEYHPNLRIFGVQPVDPGFIYIIQSGERFKIGRSRHRAERMKDAKTWLPDMKILGVKPFWNIRRIERHLHEGFARCWYHGEWFEMIDNDYRDILIDNFVAFSDSNRDMNSVDFIYWFNGDGMAEFIQERYEQGLSLPKFLKQESEVRKKP